MACFRKDLESGPTLRGLAFGNTQRSRGRKRYGYRQAPAEVFANPTDRRTSFTSPLVALFVRLIPIKSGGNDYLGAFRPVAYPGVYSGRTRVSGSVPRDERSHTTRAVIDRLFLCVRDDADGREISVGRPPVRPVKSLTCSTGNSIIAEQCHGEDASWSCLRRGAVAKINYRALFEYKEEYE